MSSSRARYGTVAAGVVATFVGAGVLFWFLWVATPVIGLLVLPVGAVVTPLVSGFAVGYRSPGSRQSGAINGAVTALFAGFLLGFVGTTVFLVGTRHHPPADWTITDLLASAGPAAIIIGAFFGIWGLVGGLAGHYAQHRAETRDVEADPREDE